MKKIIFVISLILAYSNGFAQGGFSFGIRGGVGTSLLSNKNIWDDDIVNYKPSLDWHVGLNGGYNATYYNFGISMGVFLQSYTGKTITNDTSFFLGITDIDKLLYFEIPVVVRLRPPGNSVTNDFTLGGPYFEFGILPSFLLSALHIHTDSMTENTDVKSNFEKFNFGLIMGFGFHQFGLENWSITHGIRLSYSFLDIISSLGGRGNDYKNDPDRSYKPTKMMTAQYVLTITYKWPDWGRGAGRRK